MRPWMIVGEFKIFIFKVENVFHLRIDVHLRQRTWLTAQLQLSLFQVVEVEMCVTRGMDELAWLKSSNLGHHHCQQGVAGYIEWDTKKGIGRALIKLKRELSVGHIELEQTVTFQEGLRHSRR